MFSAWDTYVPMAGQLALSMLVAPVGSLVSRLGLLGSGDGLGGMAVLAVLHGVVDNHRALMEGHPLWHVVGAFGMVASVACQTVAALPAALGLAGQHMAENSSLLVVL